MAGFGFGECTFEHGDTGYLHQQEGHQHRTEHRPPCVAGKGDEPEAPPLRCIAEIVGLTGETPQAGGQ